MSSKTNAARSAAKTTKVSINPSGLDAYDFEYPRLTKRTQLVEEETLKETLSSGIESDLFRGLAYVLPNPDPVLKKLGKDIEAYSELLADPQLYGAIENNRKPGTMSLNLYLDNPDCPKAEMEFFQTFFEQLKNDDIFYNIMNHTLDTPLFGRKVFGTKWDFVGGYFLPVEITPMPDYLCKFDYEGNLLISKDGATYASPEHPAKYIVLRHKPTLENPYGEALLSRCYWNIRFKKDGFKLWAMFTEKYGMPWVKAEYNPTLLKKAFNAELSSAASQLLTELSNMAKDGIIVYPEGVKIEIADTGKTSNSEIYEKLVRICDEQNTKLILGHSGATEATSGDKLSNDTTATDVRQHIIEADKKFPIILFNQLIYWIHQFNFAGDQMPKFDLYADEDVDMSIANRDAMLVPVLQLSGQKFSKQYFVDTYGFKEEDLEEGNSYGGGFGFGNKSQNDFMNNAPLHLHNPIDFFNAAEADPADQTLIDDNVDSNVGDTKTSDAMLKIITDYLDSKNDYKAALGSLAALFPKMNTKDLQAKLEQILFVADITGRLSAQEELGLNKKEK